MKLVNNNNDSIPVFDMKDGQIGIVTEWGNNNDIVGRIIQRYNDILISLGKLSGSSFPYALKTYDDTLRVRILQKGEQIEIE